MEVLQRFIHMKGALADGCTPRMERWVKGTVAFSVSLSSHEVTRVLNAGCKIRFAEVFGDQALLSSMFTKRRSKITISPQAKASKWKLWHTRSDSAEDDLAGGKKECPELTMMSSSTEEERLGKVNALPDERTDELATPKMTPIGPEQQEETPSKSNSDGAPADPVVGAPEGKATEVKDELVSGQQPVKADVPSPTNSPAPPADLQSPLQPEPSSGPTEPVAPGSPSLPEVDQPVPPDSAKIQDDSQAAKSPEGKPPEPSVPVTDSNSENEQEEGEAFSVKYITQLTSVTGPIEEEEVPAESLLVTHRQSISSNDADLNDFVKLDKPPARVEAEVSSFTQLLEPYKDNLAELKAAVEGMTSPSASEKLSTALSDELVTSPLAQLAEQQRDLLETFNEKFPSMNEPPEVPMDFDVPAKPFFFDQPKPMKPLEADELGNDKFSTEEGEQGTDPRSDAGTAREVIGSDFGVSAPSYPSPVLEPNTAEFSLPKVSETAGDAQEMTTPKIDVGGGIESDSTKAEPKEKKKTTAEPWIGIGVLDERLRKLIYWEEPPKSAAAFFATFASLVAIRRYSFVGVTAFLALLALLCGILLRIYAKVRAGSDPEAAKKNLQKWVSLELPREKLHVQMDVVVDALQKLLRGCQMAFLGGKNEIIRLTLTVLSLYVIGEIFTLLGLVHLGLIIIFTVPFLLKKYDKEVQQAKSKANQAFNRAHVTINEKAPFVAHFWPTQKVD